MLRLYKDNNDQILYWQTWSVQSRVFFSSGVLGQEPQQMEAASDQTSVEEMIKRMKEDGYEEPDIEYGWQWLIIDYSKIYEEEDQSSIALRAEKLAKDIDAVLFKTGLGSVDDFFYHDENIVIYCLVYDCYLAREVVEAKKDSGSIEKYEAISVSETQK